MKIVIIGGVAGGATAAARLRRLDEHAEIVVLERSGYVSYANCGLPYYIGGVIQDRKKLTLQTPESFLRRFNVDVRVHSEAVEILREQKKVRVRDLANGKEYLESYDKLIYSPGAQAMRPPFVQAGERIFTLRTVEDTFRIDDFLHEHAVKNALVIGGGFIGLEAAENLVRRGVRVTVLQMEEQVMAPFDYDMACILHSCLRENGVDLRLKHAVSSLRGEEGGVVADAAGETFRADCALVAIGVLPETYLAKAAGLDLGAGGAVVVDEHMRTSDPDIYAVGDAVEVVNPVTGAPALVALAGPANKQGRIAADNICGIASEYKGTQGSTVIKVFDMTAAVTGLNEKAAKAAGLSYSKVLGYSASHAGYYPGGRNMSIKTLFDPDTGRILGAQIVGFDGVDKRIDVLAAAIRAGLTAEDLCELELAYAPPYSSAKDPVNMAGFMIQNVMNGIVKQHFPEDVPELPRDGSVTLLDVRTAREFAGGCIEGAVNIPLHELRARLGELDKSKPVYVNCFSGMRSYIACRILTGHGFDCSNLAGGWRFYQLVTREKADNEHYPCGERK